MTKASKVYFGLSVVASSGAAACVSLGGGVSGRLPCAGVSALCFGYSFVGAGSGLNTDSFAGSAFFASTTRRIV